MGIRKAKGDQIWSSPCWSSALKVMDKNVQYLLLGANLHSVQTWTEWTCSFLSERQRNQRGDEISSSFRIKFDPQGTIWQFNFELSSYLCIGPRAMVNKSFTVLNNRGVHCVDSPSILSWIPMGSRVRQIWHRGSAIQRPPFLLNSQNRNLTRRFKGSDFFYKWDQRSQKSKECRKSQKSQESHNRSRKMGFFKDNCPLP